MGKDNELYLYSKEKEGKYFQSIIWQKQASLCEGRRRDTTPYAYRTGKLLHNGNFTVNKDYHTRKNALNIAKDHLSQIDNS